MKATDAYRKINNSPIRGIVLFYTEYILQSNDIKLGDVISQIQTGKTPPKANPKYYSTQDVNWFKPSDIGYNKYLNEAKEKFSNTAITDKKGTIYPKNTLLIIGIGGGVGRVSILKEQGSSNQQITGITFNSEINSEYAYYYYLVREDYIKSQSKSTSFPILNQTKIKGLKFKNPTLKEQNEFVKFIDACWESFLINEIPDFSDFDVVLELKEYACKQFKAIALDNKIKKNIDNELNLLSQLKQSILQEAIQGKLTADWREENSGRESAKELLNRIKAEKEQLVKDKKIKKENAIPTIAEDEIPYELPKGWSWCRLIEICTKLTDGFHHTPKKVDSGYIYISPKNLKNNKVIWSSCDYIDKKDHDYLHKKVNTTKGDILIANRGTVGTPAIVDIEEQFSFQNLALIGFNQKEISSKYIYFCLLSKRKGILDFFANGGLQPMLSNKVLKTLPLPIPCFEEQIAIAEKVESLMQKCQAIEEEIKTSEGNAQMLMQAVLKEAFEVKKVENKNELANA